MLYKKVTKDRTQVIGMANKQSSAIIVLILLLCFTTYHAVTNKVIVQLIPPHLDKRVSVAYNDASHDYHISYGLYSAILMGNVNPETVNAVVDSLSFLLAPSLYHKIKTELSTTADNLINEDSTIEFKPKSWEHESGTNLTFVTGQQIIRSNIGKAKVKTVTYEYKFEVNNYVPTITHFALYNGPARNAKYRITKHNVESRKK
jgi:conjugal transfer pilus assembly protein TraE